MDDKVVYLEYRTKDAEEEYMGRVACAECRNKTFLVEMTREDKFPLMKCACCGQHIGRFGWTNDE